MRLLPPEASYTEWKVGSPLYVLSRPLELEESPPFRRWQFRVRLWRYESFGPSTSWTVFSDERPVSGKRAAVRRVSWLQKRRHPHEPPQDEFSWADFNCDPNEIETHLSGLVGVSLVPVVPRTVVSIDGVSSGIEHHHGFSLSWQQEGPAGWQQFIERAEEIRRYLEACCVDGRKRG